MCSVWLYISLCLPVPVLSLAFHCKTNFCYVPKWRQDQFDFFLCFAQVADEYMFSLEENKKSKGRRQPLSKLPRHHPLVLQDCVSDDGKCCLLFTRKRKVFHPIRTRSDRTWGGPAECQRWASGLALRPGTPQEDRISLGA